MWACDKDELIRRIGTLAKREMIPMGQCGFILSDGNVRIAVDTVISDLYYKDTEVSRRLIAPPFPVGEMPDLDAVLITHSHADHIDPEMIMEQAKRKRNFQVIAPASILAALDIPEAAKMNIGDYGEGNVGDFSIKAIPVPHMEYEESAPGFSCFYGYLIKLDEMTIFHAGDTIPCKRLLEDVRNCGSIRYALLPINGRDREREAQGIIGNMDIQEAIDFAISVKASTLIPTHFDMFKENGADISDFSEKVKGKITTIIPEPGKVIHL